ncbi:MAG TPA: hypothetical protein ENN24_03590 [Bacteroidetes bacterium]|nr:hypothetical protein [Bacteroidota bacterium]
MQFLNEFSLCPHEDKTSREKVRDLPCSAVKINRSARENIFRSIANTFNDYLVTEPAKKGKGHADRLA